tara:strand:+ start:535 stop:1131 length:597 start_codon:yes stop_codon:yes gene_type:complete
MSLNFGNMWKGSKKNNEENNKKIISVNKFNQNRLVIPRNKAIKKNTNNMGTKAYWGTPTWFLFHSLAEKVNEEKYKKHYMVVWNFIKEICSSLPCPYCKQHAVTYVNSVSISEINTKNKLINRLFVFHNDVNVRTGKSKKNDIVLYKYKSANLNKILELFNSRFFVSYIGRRHFDDWIKNKTKEKTIKFWNFYVKNLL